MTSTQALVQENKKSFSLKRFPTEDSPRGHRGQPNVLPLQLSGSRFWICDGGEGPSREELEEGCMVGVVSSQPDAAHLSSFRDTLDECHAVDLAHKIHRSKGQN